MEIDWREDATIGATFPPLRLLSDLSLGAEQLETFAMRRGEELAYRWVQGRSRAESIGDLLDVAWEDVLRWRQVGPARREGIMRFLAMVSTDAPSIAAGFAGPGESLNQIHDGAAQTNQTREWAEAVEILGAWAATVAGGSTWADIISLASLPRPDDVADAWSIFAAFPVPIGDPPPAQDVLADYIDEMDDRRRTILLDRIIGPRKRTLDELGGQLGVTRERVRQIEVATTTAVRRTYEESQEWRSVRWATGALRARLGVIAPIKLRRDSLPGMSDILQRLVTWLAGYRYEDDLLIAEEFQRQSIADLPRLSPKSRVIDEFETIEAMLAAGVRRELVEVVIESLEGGSRVDGQLVDWTGSQEARAATVLEVRDEPQSVEDLFELAGGDSMTSFRNRIFESDRIIRVTKNKVGLRSWGGTHYTSITDLMAQRLASGPMEIQELANELEQTYEVSANSVVMYSYAPAFKIIGDMVALRGRNDLFVPRDRPETVQGLFRMSATKLHWQFDVDSDLLRGSGRAVPQEVGTFLGLSPGDDPVKLRNPYDDVPVTWSETSITGPNIGSLRLHAQGLGAVEGDVLRLMFTMGSDALAVSLVPPLPDGESPPETLSRLTGLPVGDCHDLTALAAAIGTHEDETLDALARRKDAQVAMAAQLVRLSTA